VPERPQWDSDAAAEAGRRSGEARRRAAAMNPQERALDAITKKLGSLTNELISAALGEGSFAELDPKTRVSALVRVLEYGLGKPTVAAKAETNDEPSGPTPESIFADPV